MPSPPPPSCCLCPEVEYNAGTTTLKTENVIGYVTDIVLSPLLVSEDNPHEGFAPSYPSPLPHC